MVAEQIFQITVTDPIGLHARPVGEIVKLLKANEVEAGFRRPGHEIFRANSPLKLLSMKVRGGETIELVIDTDDSDLAASLAAQISELVTGE
jgi:phosphocarrier protein HPr